MTGRAVYDVPENEQAVTLHIPYLSMLREESKKLNINLPKGYGVESVDVAVKCSLGTIRATEIERSPNAYYDDKDTLMIKFEFESTDDNMQMYSSCAVGYVCTIKIPTWAAPTTQADLIARSRSPQWLVSSI